MTALLPRSHPADRSALLPSAPPARRRRAPLAAAAALASATGLSGCGAIINYGLDPSDPLHVLGGALNDGEALGAIADEGPLALLFFSPFVLADLGASLAIDLALLPFVILDHLSTLDDPEPFSPVQPSYEPPPSAPPPAPPPPPDAPAEWPLLVGVVPAAEGPAAPCPPLSGSDLEALVATVGAGDRGALHLLAACGRQSEPGSTSITAAAPLPDGQVAFVHHATVDRFDPERQVESVAVVDLWPPAASRFVGVAARDDGACLVFASAQDAWLSTPGRARWPVPLPDAPRGGRALAARGQLVAVGGWNGDVAVYAHAPIDEDGPPPQASLVARTSVALPGEDWPTAAAWVASLCWQGGELVIARGDGQLFRWAPLGELPPAPAGPSFGSAPLALAPLERGLVVGLADGRVLRVEAGQERPLGRHAAAVLALHVHGDRVATAGLDGVVRLLALEPADEALDALDLGPIEDQPCGVALGPTSLVVVTRRGLVLRYEARR